MEYKGIEINWLHHDCFQINNGKTIVYTDPYKVQNTYKNADIIVITHDHYDHMDLNSIKKLITPKTQIVAQKDCKDALDPLENEKMFVSPGEIVIIDGVRIEAVPSYNVNKFRQGNEVFHPKEKGNVGFIITISGIRVYLAGDTDVIPEMENIRTDVALLPVSGIYVMTPEEAAQAAAIIRPSLAIPMHYGSGIGTEEDAEKFKKLLSGRIRVEILRSID